MQREILFRGKRKDTGEWIEGSLVNNLWLNSDIKEPIVEIISGPGNNDNWDDIADDPECTAQVIPETVGQFTGLLDKNGKLVFGGHLVNITNKGIYNGPKIVVWDEILLCHVFVWLDEYDKWTNSSCGITYLKISSGIKCEITGNIHYKQ